MENTQYRDATRTGDYSPEKEKARTLGAGTRPDVHGKHGADYSPPDPWRVVADFRAAIMAQGLGDPGDIEPDGNPHRFQVEGDRSGSRNGWYSLHLDNIPAGVFGSWKSGSTQTWCSISRDQLTQTDRRALDAMLRQAKAQRAAETAERQAAAAQRAQAIIERSDPGDPSHQYLAAKGIEPHGARQQGVGMLIPITVSGTLASVQTIYPDGSKRFLSGGRINGGYYLIQTRVTRPEVLIAEGFATGATLHQETGAACYVAFNANNLMPVARYVRDLHKGANIIVCADNDRWTAGNPGLTKAKAAAVEIGGKLLVPDFTGMDLSTRPTDWNDWYQLRKAGRVQA